MIKEIEKSAIKIINNEEMILIKNSETPKDVAMYGNLYEFLKDKKFLTLSELNQTSILDNKAKNVILINKKTLMSNVVQEWFASVDSIEADGEVRCQLCNQKNNWVCYIKNRHNANELHVGTKCVEKFPNIENMNIVRKKQSEITKQYNKDKRRFKFGDLEIDDPNFVTDAHNNFINIDILLPYDLHTSISKTLYNLRFIKTSYIESGGDLDEISNKYKELINEMKYLWNEAKLFNKQNKNKKLICKKYMADWLKDNHAEIWEKVSRNDGMFDITTLEHAYHSDYVLKFIGEFRKHLNDVDVKIIQVDGDSILFSIQNENYRTPLFFKMKNKNFMKAIGCHCLVSNTYKFSHLELQDVFIDQNNSTFTALHSRMSRIMHKVGFDIVKSENSDIYYIKKLPLIIHKTKWNNRVVKSEVEYKKFFITSFFERCTLLLFSAETDIEKNFIQWFNRINLSNNNWISQTQKDEFDKLSSETSFQKQREFY